MIFSPGFDTRPLTQTVNRRQLIIDTGKEAAAASSRHLVTNHWGGEVNTEDFEDFHQNGPDWNWLAFDLFQSGQCSGDAGTPEWEAPTPTEQLHCFTKEARNVPLTLRTLGPRFILPVNGEAIYDDSGASCTGFVQPNPQHYVAYRARQTGYYSLLSGATGYTVGIGGIWDWGRYCSRSVPSSYQRPISNQMQHLGDLLRSIAWYRLKGDQAEHKRIKNQEPDPQLDPHQDQRMVLARDGGTAVLAYVPDEKTEIKLDLTVLGGFPTGWTSQWVSPRSGLPFPAPWTSLGSSQYLFPKRDSCDSPCDKNDWVLKLTRTASASSWQAAATSPLAVWTEFDEALGVERAWGQIQSARGAARGGSFPLSVEGSEGQQHPKVAQADGTWVAVWQSAQPGDTFGDAVVARAFDSTGKALGLPIEVSTRSEAEHLWPEVASLVDGSFVAVWVERGQAEPPSRIVAIRLAGDGTPIGGEIEVSTSEGGGLEVARVVSHPAGGFIVGWERSGTEGNPGGVFARWFDAAGFPIGSEILARSADSGAVSLFDLDASAAGDLLVMWEGLSLDGAAKGVFGRWYDSTGSPFGDEVVSELFEEW